MADSAHQEVRELRALLVPWSDSYLLLPNAAVVEILRYREVIPESEYPDDSVLGTFTWRNLSLPLMSFERVLDRSETEIEEKKRIMVCHLLSDDEEHPFIGIEVHGMPRLIKLDEPSLGMQEEESEPEEGPVIAKVDVEGISAYIPDLERLGQLLQVS